MTPDRRSRRAVALPAGPVPTADQSPSQGNKAIISLNRRDSSNCLPVSTHPDVRRVFNEPPKKKKPRGPRHETPAKSVFAGSDRTFPRLTALRLYDYLLSRGDTRGPRQSCSIRPFFAVALENSSQSARGTFSVSPHWTAVSEVGFEIRYTSPGDRLGPRGFGGVWCEFRSEHALGEWRTTPHAAPDANAPEPHLPVRNECRSPYAGLAPSERSIERARRRNRVHTGRSSSSGKS